MFETTVDLFKDLWKFVNERKKYWLAPLIVTLMILGVLITLAQSSVVAPFIYTIY